jgi:hypothetical protein
MGAPARRTNVRQDAGRIEDAKSTTTLYWCMISANEPSSWLTFVNSLFAREGSRVSELD